MTLMWRLHGNSYGGSIDMSDVNQEKLKLIIKCLELLFIKYRKKMPEHLVIEAKCFLKDTWNIPIEEIPEMFQHAYRVHEGDFAPKIKNIITYWKAFKGERLTLVNTCTECTGGFISVRNIKEDKRYSFKCSCPAGRSIGQGWDKQLMTWDDQEGWEL